MKLDHIAIYVSNLSKSIDFYRDILHFSISEPISLKDRSFSHKVAKKIFDPAPNQISSFLKCIAPKLARDYYSEIAFGSTDGERWNILFVQQKDPVKGHIRSVSGNTIYGFSCLLAPNVDTEILGWDLNTAGVSFTYGDPFLDGFVYSERRKPHSIYVKDPDGRYIELLPSYEAESGKKLFLTELKSVILYVNDLEISKRFYCDKFALRDITPSEVPNSRYKRFIILGDESSKPIIILYNLVTPQGEPVYSGGYGVDHIAFSDVTISESTRRPEVTDIIMNPDKISELPGSNYLQDPDEYFIEILSQ